MKEEKDEALDKLFKKGADDPVNEPVFREADWDALEQSLDQTPRRHHAECRGDMHCRAESSGAIELQLRRP